MSETEIVNTCFLAAKVAEEHETRELFHVDGASPYNTHIAIGTLASADGARDYDHRHDPSSLPQRMRMTDVRSALWSLGRNPGPMTDREALQAFADAFGKSVVAASESSPTDITVHPR